MPSSLRKSGVENQLWEKVDFCWGKELIHLTIEADMDRKVADLLLYIAEQMFSASSCRVLF